MICQPINVPFYVIPPFILPCFLYIIAQFELYLITFMHQSHLPRAMLLLLLCMAHSALAVSTSPVFSTTISGSFEAGSAVLSTTSPTVSGSFSSQTTTVTYLNSYFTTPSFGFGLGFVNSNWAQTTLAR